MTDNLPTPAELATIAERELRLALDPQGTGRVDLHDGSRLTAFVSMQTALGLRVVRYVASRDAAARASTATGDDLDVVAHDDYGETRKTASAATGKVRLTRAGGGLATSVPRGSRFAVPATGSSPAVIFAAAVTVAVLAGETAVVIPLVATETGEAGNLTDPAAVTQIMDSLPDAGWSVGTPEVGTVFGGGLAAEDDDVLRARLLAIAPVDEQGTRLAILAAALRVSGARWAVAVEPYNGTVALYVGDANYVLTDAMAAAIRAELLGYRCFGVAVDLRTFNPVAVQVTATVHMSQSLDHYDLDAIARDGEALVLAYFAARPRPDEFFREMVSAAISKAHPEVQHVVLASPVADAVRPADTGYDVIVSLDRYRVLPGTVRLTFAPPLTT